MADNKETPLPPASDRHKIGAAALCLLCLAVAYFAYAPALFSEWQREEYSHGPLIPFIAVMLAVNYLKRSGLQLSPSLKGMGLVLAGYTLFIFSELSAFEPPAHYGLVFALAGFIHFFGGFRALTVLSPALVYLIFAIPLPRLIEVALTAKLMLVSSTLGVGFLQLLGIPVFQDGNIIDLGAQQLQVVEACSGLRYMFPLLSFGFLLALLFDAPLWKRAVVVLSAVPISIVMNAARIALVGIMVNRWGPGAAEGLLHDMQGWTIFTICILVLLAEIWLLSRIGKEKNRIDFDLLGFSGTLPSLKFDMPRRALLAAVSLTVILSLATVAVQRTERPELIPARRALWSFPLEIGAWNGAKGRLPGNILGTLKLTDYWIADYSRQGSANPLNLYIGYYESQRRGAAAHSPANCIPAGGWVVEEDRETTIDVNGRPLNVNRMLVRKDGTSMIVYYWFEQRGRIINNQYEAKWYLFWDSMTRSRTDGAIVRIVTKQENPQDIEASARDVENFLADAYPVIETYLPD